jgi:hypothetical protein
VRARPDTLLIRPPVFKRFDHDFDGVRFRYLDRLLLWQYV